MFVELHDPDSTSVWINKSHVNMFLKVNVLQQSVPKNTKSVVVVAGRTVAVKESVDELKDLLEKKDD